MTDPRSASTKRADGAVPCWCKTRKRAANFDRIFTEFPEVSTGNREPITRRKACNTKDLTLAFTCASTPHPRGVSGEFRVTHCLISYFGLQLS